MDAFVSYKRILVLYADHADIKSLFTSLNRQIFGREPVDTGISNPPVPQAPQAPTTAFERLEQALAAEQAAQMEQAGEGISSNETGQDANTSNTDNRDLSNGDGAVEGENDAGQCRSWPFHAFPIIDYIQ
jgi:hypothetical protein